MIWMRASFLILFLGLFSLVRSQGIIGTQESLVLVYNFPDAHFYIELQGRDKSRTERDDCFLIDNKLVQVHAVGIGKFLDSTQMNLEDDAVIAKYIAWEADYLKSSDFSVANSKVKFGTSKKGRDYAFWSYDMPPGEPEDITDTTQSLTAQKQLFVITRVKDYIVGINTPLFNKSDFAMLKNYLTRSVDGIVESRDEINLEELNKEVNK